MSDISIKGGGKRTWNLLSATTLDELEAFAAIRLVAFGRPPEQVVQELAQGFPSERGQTFVFVLSLVASILEAERAPFQEKLATPPADIFRCAAILAADVFELEVLRGKIATGESLLTHWRRNDDSLFAS